ncbi:molybdenum cofactor guanylyltransferase MobA [Marinivivus vitaminiproducens]|uniref:molybdenum cofactor guanylyltransferase MobA n=1 Tax=Marinivivus vitaminiproducens TaxID=3035935 RepID=UPI0027A52DB3|nr:molybdenum cofactor guanylyltransferase MobA [Geminicoccaceae bacterium SCSIO 64248]
MTGGASPGVILAGGRSSRMGGGDKSLLVLQGRTLLEHVIARLGPQADGLVLNANGDPGRFAGFGLTVVPDTAPDQPGPLAGILSGLRWAAAQRPDCSRIITAAADTPFMPADLALRLAEAAEAAGADIALARSRGRTHPVFGLWPVALADDLEGALDRGERRVLRFAQRYRLVEVDFPADPADPFFNVNTPGDLATAESLIAGGHGILE